MSNSEDSEPLNYPLYSVFTPKAEVQIGYYPLIVLGSAIPNIGNQSA